jgi:hypothetical protein
MSTIPSPGHMHYLPLSFLLGMEGLEPSRFKKSTDFRTTIVFTTDPAEGRGRLWSGLYLDHRLAVA